MIVRELELDLDAFEGPFDLLLTLVLREELPLAEVDVAGIVLAWRWYAGDPEAASAPARAFCERTGGLGRLHGPERGDQFIGSLP